MEQKKKNTHSYFSDRYSETMPALNIERTRLPREMHDALKRHILRERQRKKDEADANEADKRRRRAEKVSLIIDPLKQAGFSSLGSSIVVIESSVGRQCQRHSGIRTNSNRSRTAESRTVQLAQTSIDRRRSTETFTTDSDERTIVDQSLFTQ